jgi:uncharacterized delta-60 repeat protein
VTAFGGRNPRGAVARALATQPDGKIVAAGEDASRFALARYTVRGKLDPSFGRDGKVLTRFGGSSDVRAVALQPDGKIVVAGAALIHQRDSFALARYTAHGRLDMGFGASGRVVTDVGPWSEANAMALDKGGNLVVAGGVGFKDFGLARYTADGELDPGFGDGGTITTNFLLDCPTCVSDDWAYAVAIQRDGKIVAAGGTDAGGAVGPKGGELDSFALARYSEDGVLDPTFGSGGKLVTRFGGRNSVVQAIAIQADGKLLAAGGGAGYFSLARYTRNGGLDRTFGRGGTVLTSFQ